MAKKQAKGKSKAEIEQEHVDLELAAIDEDNKEAPMPKRIKKQTSMTEIMLTLDKELRELSRSMGHKEAEKVVKAYYAFQHIRMAQAAKLRDLQKDDVGCKAPILSSFLDCTEVLEGQIRNSLKYFALSHGVGEWSLGICGIGPVLAAGMIAYVDMDIAVTPGRIYSFAGIHPDVPKATKGEKRKYNPALKVLCWKIGQSFLKTKNNPKDFYGHILQQRWELEKERDAEGLFEKQAKAALEGKVWKNKEVKEIYESGHLPAGHLLQRACRYATKLYLSHWWEVAYTYHHKKKPDIDPWVFAHGGHVDRIPVPNWVSPY